MNDKESELMDAVRCSMAKEIECCNSTLQSLANNTNNNLNRSVGWWEGRKALAEELHDQILNEQLKGHI